MKLESVAQVIGFDPYTVDTAAAPGSGPHDLGEAVYVADGRIFRYARANGTSTAGKLQQAPAAIANHTNMTTAAAAIGVTQVTCTPGATAGGAGIYNEGYLIVNAGTGLGQIFKVSTQPAITSSTAFTVTLFDPIVVALDATSKTSLLHNAYNLVIQSATQTLRPSGVPLATAAANNYFWLQTRGIASVLSDGAVALGNTVVASSAVAGAVVIGSTTYGTFQATMPVGKAVVAGVDTEYRPVWLTID